MNADKFKSIKLNVIEYLSGQTGYKNKLIGLVKKCEAISSNVWIALQIEIIRIKMIKLPLYSVPYHSTITSLYINVKNKMSMKT